MNQLTYRQCNGDLIRVIAIDNTYTCIRHLFDMFLNSRKEVGDKCPVWCRTYLFLLVK